MTKSRTLPHTFMLSFWFGVMAYAPLRAAELENDPEDQAPYAMMGMSQADAEILEAKLRTNPQDLASRSKLLGFYFQKSFQECAEKEAHHNHVYWLIENRPEAKVSGSFALMILPLLDTPGFLKARDLWLKQMAKRPKDLRILANAASFFNGSMDKTAARELWEKGLNAEPQNPEWYNHLASLEWEEANSSQCALPEKAAEKAMALWERGRERESKENQDGHLSDMAEAAEKAGLSDKARAYAEEALASARLGADASGRQKAGVILGLLSLKAGDLKAASRHLKEAEKIATGANTGGPILVLAGSLLEAGERVVVLEFLDARAKYPSPLGDSQHEKLVKAKAAEWAKRIRSGQGEVVTGEMKKAKNWGVMVSSTQTTVSVSD